MFLLDTNVVSELRKAHSGKANANVAGWAAKARASSLFLSAIVVQELEVGALRIERRDPQQGALIRRWLEAEVLRTFADRILPIDVAIARRSAALNVPDPRPFRDSLIAATALVHGLTVVTRNISDFASTGVSLLNPWQTN